MREALRQVRTEKPVQLDEGNGYNEAYELGTNEYREYIEKLTPGEVDEASARADAMRAMRKGKEVDPADVDTDASPEDIKGAERNIIMQLRKVVSLKGIGKVQLTPKQKRDLQKKDSKYLKTLGSGYVEFAKGQEKVDLKVAQAVLDKFNSIKKPADKEKFQAQVGKSYKDMLRVLKAGYNEEVELDEWTVSDVEIAMKKKYGKVDKEAIAKLKKVQYKGNVDRNDLVKVGHGKLDVAGLAYSKEEVKETILERIDRKLKEKKELLEAANRWELGGKKFSLINDKGTFILVPQGRSGKEQKLKAKTSQDATQELVKKGYRES
jgi:hypothetical protein